LDEEYRAFLHEYSLGHKRSTVDGMKWLIEKLPPIEELSRGKIIEVLASHENHNTRAVMLSKLRLLLRYLDRLELIKGIRIPLRPTAIQRSDLLTSSDISALLRGCRTLAQRALIELLVESGVRIGEILNLRVQDIEPRDRLLLVTLNGKTGPRQVPLLRANLTNFLEYLSCCDEKVFKTEYSALRKQFMRLYRRAGVDRPKMLFHIFRHTRATHLVELGVPEAIIRRFMGWTPGSNMIQVYVHLSNRSVMDFFARMYDIEPEPLEPLYPDEDKQRVKGLLG